MSKNDGRKQRSNERHKLRRARSVPYDRMKQYAAERKYAKLVRKQKKNKKRFRKIWSWKVIERHRVKDKILRLEPRRGHTPRMRKVIR